MTILATYSDIKASARDWTGTDSTVIADATFDNFLVAVEQQIWARLRVREMRDSYEFTYATGGVAFTTVESNILLDVLSVNVILATDDIRTPPPVAEYRLRQLLQETNVGSPMGFGWVTQSDGTTKLVIGPEPIGATVDIAYFKKFPTLSSSTNAAFLAYPHIWEAGMIARGFLYQQDIEMYQVWKDQFETFIATANELNRSANEALKGNTTAPNYGAWRP